MSSVTLFDQSQKTHAPPTRMGRAWIRHYLSADNRKSFDRWAKHVGLFYIVLFSALSALAVWNPGWLVAVTEAAAR
jgi:hypothetical protein